MLILIRHRIAPAPGEMGYCYIHPLPSSPSIPLPITRPTPWGLRTSLAAIPFIRPLLLLPECTRESALFRLSLLLWGADFDTKSGFC